MTLDRCDCSHCARLSLLRRDRDFWRRRAEYRPIVAALVVASLIGIAWVVTYVRWSAP